MALAGKYDKKDYRVFALLGDGEMQEGSVWEALMAAAHYKLNNLMVFVDNNNLQIDGRVSDVMSIYPIEDKLSSFGFETVVVEDGNDIAMLKETVTDLLAKETSGPKAVVARTVKGKGVSFMEDQAAWHGTAPSREQAEAAVKEIMEG